MATKKTIAIIGATGKMGSAIAGSLAKGNYRLLLFSREQEQADRLANDLFKNIPSAEVECIGCSFHASWEADIIIPAVPFSAEKEIAESIREVATQKIVLSISNPLNENFDGLVTDINTSAAEELQKLLPDSKIVKAFNTTFAAGFSQPVIEGQQIDSLIAGNDADALETVSELVRTTGFNPVVAGKLAISRTLENMTALMIQLNHRYHYNWLAGWKILHNTYSK
jgi:NADPH-dependent F420 reductase